MKARTFQSRTLLIAGSAVVFALCGMVLCAHAYTGPATSGGTGSGAISSDASADIAIGTSTTQATSKFLIVGASAGSGNSALNVLNSAQTVLLGVRNDGLVTMGGNLNVTGTIAGALTGTISAPNVSGGEFGGAGGGNFYFPANVGIGATSPTIYSGQKALFIGLAGGLVGNTGVNVTRLEDNLYYSTAGLPTYINAGYADELTLDNSGNFDFLTAPSGSAGNTFTWVQPLTILNAGKVGINNTTPGYALDVTGDIDFTGNLYKSGVAFSSGSQWTTTSTNIYYSSGNVGIGTASPANGLLVVGTDIGSFNIGKQVTIGNTGGNSGLGIGQSAGNNVELYWVYNATASSAAAHLETSGYSNPIYINGSTIALENSASGYVGIGTASPSYTLDVTGTARFTQPIIVGTPTASNMAATKSYVDSAVAGGGTGGSFTTFSASGNWSLSGAAQASLNMNGYSISGISKITVTTVDPVYNIDGVKYATYGPESTGIVVTSDGKGRLATLAAKNDWTYTLDFGNAAKGSDLWLFWQTIDQGQNLENVSLTLTPEGGAASMWYEPAGNTIVVHGDHPVEFSYHLSAPRYDDSKWPNTIVTNDEVGTVLVEK